MKSSLIAVAVLLVLVTPQSCDFPLGSRVDCGGINQQFCEGRGCCWAPTNFTAQSGAPIPSCFYKQTDNLCSNISYNWSGGIGFDSTFYDKMYALFDANIDIEGKGGIVAAPDYSTPGGSYYYHWMRDGALTMRTYMQINNFDLTKIQKKMKSYVNWVTITQQKVDPQQDVRINPKFQLPNGDVFSGIWCRPQTDGPGLQSASLQMFANLLLDQGQTAYVNASLLGIIKYDLEWVINSWQSYGCDPWEQVYSYDFFWGRASFVYTLDLCVALFNRLGDSSYASKCSSAKSTIQATLDSHWTGTFMAQSSNRQKDGIVVHAFSSFNTIYPITDQKVAKTMQVLAQAFCLQYAINQKSIQNGIPGILIGRYPGDIYAGGNPWQLLTAVFAKAFYQGANVLMKSNGFLKAADQKAWFNLLKLPEAAPLSQQVKALIQAGDAVLYKLYQYVKDKDGHIDEQIDRNTGVQKSARDLTWSYAQVLSAMKEREKAVGGFGQQFEGSTQ